MSCDRFPLCVLPSFLRYRSSLDFKGPHLLSFFSKVTHEEKKSHEKSARLLRDFSETEGTQKLQANQHFTVESDRLQMHNERLWHRNQVISLTNKASVVLRYLVEYTERLVTKAELFAALWPGTAVSDGALTFCIVEPRKAPGDNATAPRFIEAVHRRGYRFIAPIHSGTSSIAGSSFLVNSWLRRRGEAVTEMHAGHGS